MAEPRGTHAAAASRKRQGHPWTAQGSAPSRRVLCLVPRRLRLNPLIPLLRAYSVSAAETSAQVLRLAREHAFDLYVVLTPLYWIGGAEACRRVRKFDPHTPIIVYSLEPSASERREVTAAGAQAYVARTDPPHNLSGIAGQLVMLTELRSMEAMNAGGESIQVQLAAQIVRLTPAERPARLPLRAAAQARLKVEARRLFAQAGGSRANFERFWPALYEGALKKVPRAHGSGVSSETPS